MYNTYTKSIIAMLLKRNCWNYILDIIIFVYYYWTNVTHYSKNNCNIM